MAANRRQFQTTHKHNRTDEPSAKDIEMAGSHLQATSSLDSVLFAQLEALQLLGDQITERVLVVGPDLTILYANDGAWPQRTRGALASSAKCYEAVLNESDPCRVCAAKEVFDSGEMRPL